MGYFERLEHYQHELLAKFIHFPTEGIVNSISHVRNRKFLFEADSLLEKGGSLLTLSNHSTRLETTVGVKTVFSNLTSAKIKRILISERLYKGGDRKISGVLSRAFLSSYGIKPLPVYLAKHGWNREEEMLRNLPMIREVSRTLSKPGGVVFIYPEGESRKSEMIEAKRGLSEFLEFSHVLPVTTCLHGPIGVDVTVHKPISGNELNAYCSGQFGKDAGKIAASDFVMTIIALALADEKRGFYREPALIVERVKNGEKIVLKSDISDRFSNMVMVAEFAQSNSWF